MILTAPRRRIVKPSPGEVWLHGNPHPLAKGLVFAGGISSDHGGTRYFDFAGKNHGTLMNMSPATDWVVGPRGWALDFDGTNDNIDLGNNTTPLLITSAFSVGVRFKLTASSAQIEIFGAYSQNPNVAGYTVGVKVDGASGSSQKFGILTGNNTGTTANVNYKVLNSTQNVDDGLWHQGVAVWDGASLYIYVDGKFSSSVAWANAPAYAATTYCRIACLATTGTNILFFPGQIESTLLYNRALSASEIAELYQDPGFTWATRPRRRVFGFTAAGGTTFNESGDLSAIPSLTSLETLTLSESGTLSAVPTLTADQTVSMSGVGDLSAIPSLTADQTIAANESGDLSGVPSITGDVANAFDESATLSGIPSLTGDHTYTLQGGSTLSAVPSLTVDQTVTMNLSGELSAIPSLTGVDTGLAGVVAFNGGGRSEFVGPPARSSQFRSGRNNVSEFKTGRWVN